MDFLLDLYSKNILIRGKRKNSLIQMIHRMPDTTSVEDIMAELYFRQKVDAGLHELDEGKGIGHKEAKERLMYSFR